MRIISGDLRGRKIISPPPSLPTRPITDRVRESIFNLLRGHIEDQRIVDLFAGTGTIGLEALSRGAQHCLFVEQNRKTAQYLKQNIESFGLADRSDIFIGDALSPAFTVRITQPAHIIFFDPPYAFFESPESATRIMDQLGELARHCDPDGFLILRTPEHLGGEITLTHPSLAGPETHDYGTMALHLYQPASQ